jgi:hypothetical protein
MDVGGKASTIGELLGGTSNTSFDKAIAAALGLVFWALNNFGGIDFGLSQETFNGLVAAITPMLVWLVPNKKVA